MGPAERDGPGGARWARRSPPSRSTEPGRPGSGAGYSPITDQMKPIMMKKPLNMATRPRPPYGELAPS
jgi:hypothetical protein